MWGERAPETAHAILQGYVSGLRRTLGAELIVTRSPGYVLQANPGCIDLNRFDALVRAGKEALAAGDASSAANHFAEGISLWRGEPLEDLDSVSFLETERARLHELRLGALEERFEAELALGHHAEVIPDLQRLVREEPLRERLRGQLMLALYRSGRQAEALDVYRQGRQLLAGELGLEPGEPLRRLERAILEQDPALGHVVRMATPAPPVEPTERRPVPRGEHESATIRTEARGTRRRLWVAIVATCAIGGAAVAFGLALTGGRSDVPVVPNSVAVIDVNSNRLVDDVPLGQRPVAIASGLGGIWVCQEGGVVARIDPTARRVVKRIDVGTDCHDVAVGFGSVWVAGGDDGTVVRIDPALNEGEDVVAAAGNAGSVTPVLWVATGARRVWATRGDLLLRIDPAGKHPVRTTPIPPAAGLAAGRATAWVVTEPDDNRLLRFDPGGREEHPQTRLPPNSVSPTAAPGAVVFIAYVGLGEVERYTISGDPTCRRTQDGTHSTSRPAVATSGW